MNINMQPVNAIYGYYSLFEAFIRDHAYLVLTISLILCLWVMLVGAILFYAKMAEAAMLGEASSLKAHLQKLMSKSESSQPKLEPMPTEDGFLCYSVTCKQVNNTSTSKLGTIIEEGVLAKNDEAAMDAAVKALWEGKRIKAEVLAIRVVEGI